MPLVLHDRLRVALRAVLRRSLPPFIGPRVADSRFHATLRMVYTRDLAGSVPRLAESLYRTTSDGYDAAQLPDRGERLACPLSGSAGVRYNAYRNDERPTVMRTTRKATLRLSMGGHRSGWP